MAESAPAREGIASFQGFTTPFRVLGESSSRRPVLCIHGGPGWGYDYLHPLEQLLATGRQVVFYRQLGCTGEELAASGAGWSLDLYLDELEAVRAAAGLDRCHIVGHGWGGMIALEYALTQPPGLTSLVLSSTVANVPHWRSELVRMIAAGSGEVRASLCQHEEEGTTASAACRCTVDAFLRRHFCRMNPWPACLVRSHENARLHPAARTALFGPSELEPAGLLADWNVTSRLGEIRCPTLVTCGRHDLASPETAAILYQGIAGSEWVVLENSAHVPHLEEPDRYLELLDGFLAKADRARRRRS